MTAAIDLGWVVPILLGFWSLIFIAMAAWVIFEAVHEWRNR